MAEAARGLPRPIRQGICLSQIDAVPWVTAEQMKEVDRLMIEHWEIDLFQMMENAGRALAQVARERFFAGDPRGQSILVMSGPGGNGGGALVAARRLHGYGAKVMIGVSRSPEKLSPAAARQLSIAARIGIPVVDGQDLVLLALPELIIDGLIGYGISGSPSGTEAHMIVWANNAGTPVLALDLPSGLDATTGVAHAPTIHAAATLTLALPKLGLRTRPDLVGDLYLADIGIPPETYARLGLDVGPIFARSDVVTLF